VRSDEPLVLELAAFRDALAGKVTRTGVSGPEARAALAVTLAIQRRIEAHVVDTDAP